MKIDTSAAATDTIDYVTTDQNGLTSTSTRTIIIQTPASSAAAAATPDQRCNLNHRNFHRRENNMNLTVLKCRSIIPPALCPPQPPVLRRKLWR